MSGRVGAATARLRLVLALAMSGVVALLMPSGMAVSVDASSAVLLAALAFAVVAVVALSCHGAASVPTTLALQPGTADDTPCALAGRATDPLHHPLRPRAPGLV